MAINKSVRDMLIQFRKDIIDGDTNALQKYEKIKQIFIKSIEDIIRNADNQSVIHLSNSDKMKSYYFNDKIIVETTQNYNRTTQFSDIKGRSIGEMLFDDIIYDNLDIFGYNHLFNLVSVDSEQTGGTFNTFRQQSDGAGATSEIPNDFDDLYLPFNKDICVKSSLIVLYLSKKNLIAYIILLYIYFYIKITNRNLI